MKKLKLYLDTSVISHLKQDDTPDKMTDTLNLWRDIEHGKFEIYLSEVTLDEIGRCTEEKLSVLSRHLKSIDYTLLSGSDEIVRVANQIINLGILTQKSFDDCLHIAHAVVYGCDCIVSWNFKHMVNIKTIKGVRAITNLGNYGSVDIVAPPTLLESEVE